MEPQTMIEKEREIHFKVKELPPMGYGNAESTISRTKQLKSGELPAEVDTAAQEAIKSGESFRKVDDTDDGCIDGRETEELLLFVNENGEFYTKPADNSNHERAKVAGGGYITSQAIRLGAGVRGKTIDGDLLQLGTDLAEKGVYCGAHSGSYKHDEATDCGANDKFSLILQNALAFEQQITATAKVLIETAGLTFDENIAKEVLKNWQTVLTDEGYFEGSTGNSRLKTILATQAATTEARGEKKPTGVTKHLGGDHNEDYIIVNYVEGTTFSQNDLKSSLKEKFPDMPDKKLAQTFVVDAWRVVELADAAVEEDKKEIGIYAGVMYQLATAATLTDGSLKIFTCTE